MASSCSSDDSSGAPPLDPTQGGVLRIGLQVETSGFQPAADQWFSSGYLVAQAVYDRLMAYDENGELRPYLAESMTSDDDFTEWTIGLRPGVRFHDGTPMDAVAVKMNLDAGKASPLVSQVFLPVESVEVVDDLTVAVKMNTPWSSFPHTLTYQPGYIAAPATLEDPQGGQRPIGTGPFRFEEWDRDARLVVSRNDDYWRPELPRLDGIEFLILSEPTTRTAALESGDVDLIESRNAETLARFEGREAGGDGFRVYVSAEGETTEHAIFFNTGAPPFASATARQAVVAAIDDQAISDTLFAGRFPPASGPFKPGSPWNRDVVFQGYDPELARRLADDYEAETGEALSFSLLTTPDSEASALAQLLEQMMTEAGIDMSVDTIDATGLIVRGLTGDYDAGVIDQLWGSQHPDREYMLLLGANALPVGSFALNFTRYANDALDEGLALARSTADAERQADGWQAVQESLAEDFVWAFLVHDEVGDVAKADVRDVTDWTFPDGTPGLPQEGTLLSLHQIWLEHAEGDGG
jgi:peptide/nickel transport system substrate-binding protein